MIRVFATRDGAAVAALQQSAFEDRWSADFIESLLIQPGVFAALAGEPHGPAQGAVVVRSVAGEAEILTLAVIPASRRRGMGRALVRFAAEKAHQIGAACLFLEVGSENRAAKALYTGLGFAPVGRRPGYYRGAGGILQDALILRVALPLCDG
jgi:[ribosomal protein S18]-alanine N-acetyltransferase